MKPLGALALCAAIAGCGEKTGEDRELFSALELISHRIFMVVDKRCVLRINDQGLELKAAFVEGRYKGEFIEALHVTSTDKDHYAPQTQAVFLRLDAEDQGAGVAAFSLRVPGDEMEGGDLLYEVKMPFTPAEAEYFKTLADQHCADYR